MRYRVPLLPFALLALSALANADEPAADTPADEPPLKILAYLKAREKQIGVLRASMIRTTIVKQSRPQKVAERKLEEARRLVARIEANLAKPKKEMNPRQQATYSTDRKKMKRELVGLKKSLAAAQKVFDTAGVDENQIEREVDAELEKNLDDPLFAARQLDCFGRLQKGSLGIVRIGALNNSAPVNFRVRIRFMEPQQNVGIE